MTAVRETIKTLLVEDDPALADLAAEMLELLGCDVTALHTPEKAMQHLSDNSDYMFLFTDYTFPGSITGVELADQVVNAIPQIKVTIATGMDQETIRSQTSPSYSVIMKPYLLSHLQDLMQTLFPA